jgi:hypothetical protein
MIKGISAANVDPPAMPCRWFASGHSAEEAERENFQEEIKPSSRLQGTFRRLLD